jgi:hypothetical protein
MKTITEDALDTLAKSRLDITRSVCAKTLGVSYAERMVIEEDDPYTFYVDDMRFRRTEYYNTVHWIIGDSEHSICSLVDLGKQIESHAVEPKTPPVKLNWWQRFMSRFPITEGWYYS